MQCWRSWKQENKVNLRNRNDNHPNEIKIIPFLESKEKIKSWSNLIQELIDYDDACSDIDQVLLRNYLCCKDIAFEVSY